MFKKSIYKIVRKIKNFFYGIFWFLTDLFKYKSLLKAKKIDETFYFYPKIFDKDPKSHTFDKHYVYMDRWAFCYLLELGPKEHVDVGSSIRFLSMASCVTKLKFVDIRPIELDLNNFQCIKGSILKMPFGDNELDSLSCLHVAEHIGLGRYGDFLDPSGTENSCKELTRVLAPGGKLYFALPVGKNATYFNAHRVHSPSKILEYFSGLKLLNFSAVKDDGHFYENIKPDECQDETYACGMFLFTK